MDKKKTPRRPYLLTHKDGTERIVEATSQQQAIFHAAKTTWEVAPLTTADALRLGNKVPVEQAGDLPAANQQTLPLDPAPPASTAEATIAGITGD